MKGKQTELDLWIDGTIATNLLVDWSQRSYRKERVHRKQKWEKVGGRLLTRKKKRWAWKGKFRSCATTRRWARRRRTFGRKLKTSLSWWIPGQGITLSMNNIDATSCAILLNSRFGPSGCCDFQEEREEQLWRFLLQSPPPFPLPSTPRSSSFNLSKAESFWHCSLSHFSFFAVQLVNILHWQLLIAALFRIVGSRLKFSVDGERGMAYRSDH